MSNRMNRSVRRGFSLAEAVAALLISAMILTAVIGIYGRSQKAAAAIGKNIDSAKLPHEVLQRIAEDLDSIVSTGDNTKVTFQTKSDKEGYSTARLEIRKTVLGKDNKVEQRMVTKGFSYEKYWVIKKGLKNGETVISQGLQKIKKTGVQVQPVKADEFNKT